MSDPYVGEVRIFGGNFPPQGWAFCDGSLMSISENETLFALIGTTYGGDGQSTFALPNLISRIPVSQGTGTQGITFTMGQLAGEESVTLTAPQLASHTHAVQASDSAATSTDPSGSVWATAADAPYSTSDPNTAMDGTGVAPTGSGLPHDNRAPALGLSFIISLFGIFPSQSLAGGKEKP